MEKGLKTLQATGRTAARRDRNVQENALHPSSNASEFGDYVDMSHRSPSREYPQSHPNSDDGFNDSAIGPDVDHPLIGRSCIEDNNNNNNIAHHSLRTSPQSTHNPPPFNHHAYPTPSRGHTPPFPPPTRTFSNASSSALSSTDFTPTIPIATKFPSQLYHSNFGTQIPAAERQRQNSLNNSSKNNNNSGQTLPSFSDAFGMPSITGVSRMPLTSMS